MQQHSITYVCTLDAFFCQIKSFRRFRLAFSFGLQTYYLIDFSKIYWLTCKILKNDIFFIQKSKKFFCSSCGMKALMHMTQNLWLSKVQIWGQLLRGCHSTFLIALGEILSIFIRIFGFHQKILLIMMFGLHFSLLYAEIAEAKMETKRQDKLNFFDEILKFS